MAVGLNSHSSNLHKGEFFHFNTYLSDKHPFVCDMDSEAGSSVPELMAGAAENDYLPQIISQDPDFAALKKLAAKVAVFPSTILLTGETGTGKELFAKGIHSASFKKGRSFYYSKLRGHP